MIHALIEWLIDTFLYRPHRKINNGTHSLQNNALRHWNLKRSNYLKSWWFNVIFWIVYSNKCELKAAFLFFLFCHFYITPGRATKTLAVMHQRLCGQAVSITGEWPSGWHSGSDWRDSEGEQWVSKTLHSSPLSCGLWSKTGRWAKETDAKWLFPWCIIIPWKQKKPTTEL